MAKLLKNFSSVVNENCNIFMFSKYFTVCRPFDKKIAILFVKLIGSEHRIVYIINISLCSVCFNVNKESYM